MYANSHPFRLKQTLTTRGKNTWPHKLHEAIASTFSSCIIETYGSPKKGHIAGPFFWMVDCQHIVPICFAIGYINI